MNNNLLLGEKMGKKMSSKLFDKRSKQRRNMKKNAFGVDSIIGGFIVLFVLYIIVKIME